jgi:PAS domain S-box-containing protein
MDREAVLARLARDPKLPTPPAIALRVLERASKPDCALTDLSKLIAHDPGLCAKLLKIVNSAFFSLPNKVTDIGRALSLLGLKRVRSLVLGLSLPSMQRRNTSDGWMSDHWRASVATAMAAREWAATRGRKDADSEMVAALLCDIGSLILREVFPDAYARLLDRPIEEFVHHQCRLEEEILGVHHAEVGAYLLRRWGLPDELADVIGYHHFPELLQGKDAVILDRANELHFASLIGQLQLVPNDPILTTEIVRIASQRYGRDAAQMDAFLEPLRQKIDEFASLIDVRIGAVQPYPTLMANATEQLAHIAAETALENIRVNQEKDRANRLRQESEDQLNRLARQYELILDAVGEGIFGIESQGRITFVNPSASRLLNWPREEMIGRFHHEELLPAEGGLTPAWEQSPFFAVLRDGKVRHLEDGRFTRRDGASIPVRCTCAPVYEKDVIVGAVVSFRDVSEVKQAEEALRRSEEQFRHVQKMEAIGRLAGGVAHDFNNLLTIISGYSDLLLCNILGPNDPAREGVDEIRKAADRAAALTRQLLAFSRREVLTPRILDLNAIISDMEKMLRRLIGADVRLSLGLAKDLGTVKADPGQIEQVLLNLAVNARDAMPQGGNLLIETANVTLDETNVRVHSEVIPGPFVVLKVTDTGCGMDKATQARIFEPFFTTKGAGKGTGLGLATVYGIVKQAGGSIEVSSEVGRGTSFEVFFPRVDETPPVAPSSSSKKANFKGGKETLLVVEDDAAVRSLTRTVLSAHSYSVIEAADADDALRWVAENDHPIDLLLTDVVMPGMSGRVLAQHLELLRPGIKVMYMSGYTDDAVVRHGLMREEINFLQKPFSPETLASKVRAVLDRKKDML